MCIHEREKKTLKNKICSESFRNIRQRYTRISFKECNDMAVQNNLSVMVSSYEN